MTSQKEKLIMSNQFGSKIRQLREAQHLLLRQVAHHIEIDTPHLSKVERGERQLRKEAIPILAKLLNANENELKTLWLADQLYNVVEGEPLADEALKTVTKNLKKLK